MKIKYSLSFLFLIGIFAISIAQNSKEVLCKILDKETNYPVSYATIRFENSNNGVVADEDGGFRLPIEYKTFNKIIIISSIGFETLTISINTLAADKVNTIYLKPKVEALSAVLVIAETKSSKTTPSTISIIEQAIRRISKNYPISPHSYMAYYRDYQLVNNKYYNLNESILEAFDAGFHTSKILSSKNVTAKYSYKRNDNYYLDSLLLESIYGESKIINKDESARLISTLNNELEILNGHNPIRNYNTASFSFVDTFMYDFIPNHVFTLEGVKYINDVPLYEISFISHDIEKAKFGARGKIYIAKNNYAIYKIEYKMIEDEKYNNVVSNIKSSRFKNSNSIISNRQRLNTIYEVNVEYKPINGKMYLNYMTFNNRFIIKNPNPFKISDFEFDPNDEAFYVTFNKSVDESTIERKSRFKLFYKGKKLIIETIKLISPNNVKVEVVDWAAGTDAVLTKVKPEDFSYRIKSVKDVTGGKLDKESKLIGFQFRELFTQEIFENKKPSSDLFFVYKKTPLSESKINTPNFDINKYWINSPLKQTKDSFKM